MPRQLEERRTDTRQLSSVNDMESLWASVDEYFGQHLLPPDDVLNEALIASTKAGLPAINVTPAQGKFLYLLARIRGARRILEVGTLGGYSTIWLARALPAGGRLITLEIDAAHAAVAEENLLRAGLSDRVQILVAPASESLAKLSAEHAEAFDLVFIDADKVSSAPYFQAALGLSRVGTLIVVDNVVRKGEVIDGATPDVNVQGIRRLTELLAHEPRITATAIQTVGSKGYDGCILALVTALDAAPA